MGKSNILAIHKNICYYFSVKNGGPLGPFATIDCEPRQARKGAAVTVDSSAEVWLLGLPPNMRILIMSYIALARKWRPRTFSQLVGQDHVNIALINSLNHKRLHHAYLFTGTRGVGKTSIARLLAKALNCQQGISSEPCLSCDTCTAIEQGRFIDLIEIDGASRTRVEDTREILDNVQYAPTNGDFKIYLIDEVHMLSQHSFNALLKILEEPPAHVKFILATTDPQKLPVTVLSRCLQFHLKPLQPEVICQYLASILDAEKLCYEKSALMLLSSAAKGSMRDALSLLDQIIASCSSKQNLSLNDVKDNLGYTRQDYALKLIYALAEQDPKKLIVISREIADEGGQFRYVLDEMLHHLHQISIYQNVPDIHTLINPLTEITTLCSQFSPEDIQLFYQIALKGTQDILLAPTIAMGFEMTLLRMYTFRPSPKQYLPSLMHESTNDISTPSSVILDRTINTSNEINYILQSKDNPSPITSTESKNHNHTNWSEITSKLNLQGLALSAVEHAEFANKCEGSVILRVEKGHRSVFTPTVISRIESALTMYYGEKIILSIHDEKLISSSPQQEKENNKKKQQDSAEAALANDPFFQQLKHDFSGELVKNSISTRKDDL